MIDIVLEVIRASVTGIILIILWKVSRSERIFLMQGWRNIFFGFLLVFLGFLLDITDNFPSLNQFVIIGDTSLQAFFEKIFVYLAGYTLLAYGFWQWLPNLSENHRKVSDKLKKAEGEVRVLQGILPICASCNHIRDERGCWKRIEEYISNNSEVEFSHSVCPDCFKELYPEEYASLEKERNSIVLHSSTKNSD